MAPAMILFVLLAGSGHILRGTSGVHILENKLVDSLMKGYTKVVRPATPNNQTVTVAHGLTLIRIVDLKDDVLTIDTWVDMEWTDPRLQWNSADYEAVDTINLPSDLLWLPDIALYNNADGDLNIYHASSSMSAQISAEGTVFLVPAVRFHVSCASNNGRSSVDPDGHYTCTLKFGSWSYDGFRLDIKSRREHVDLSSLYESTRNQWTVSNTSVVRNVIMYSCCPEPFPDLTYTIELSPRYGQCFNRNQTAHDQPDIECLYHKPVLLYRRK